MAHDENQKILFSDYFDAGNKSLKKALSDYGAFDISLLSDLPLFIDPFLLFNSTNAKYQELHKDIIRYLAFLRDKSVSGAVTSDLQEALYMFTEVKQTWLGFTLGSNKGSGLGPKFAQALDNNLAKLFNDPDKELITDSEHLEKLCLLGANVGKDSISDFTTNLISGYLAGYTQEFAKAYLAEDQCSTFYVEKAQFNYETEVWQQLPFYLPRVRINFPKAKDDYILLTPRNLLTRENTWINQDDLIRSFSEIRNASKNEALRGSINNYFLKRLPDMPAKKQSRNGGAKGRVQTHSKSEYRKAIQETIKQFPILIDYLSSSTRL